MDSPQFPVSSQQYGKYGSICHKYFQLNRINLTNSAAITVQGRTDHRDAEAAQSGSEHRAAASP